MAKLPQLPLFTDAFIADTVHLDAMETGAYLMLLMCAWRSPDCKLPNDDKLLARYARCNARQWQKIKPSVMSFFEQDELQKWYQQRLLKEHIFVTAKLEQQKQAGKASALKRKETGSTDVENSGNGRSNGSPTPTPTPIPIPNSIKNPPISPQPVDKSKEEGGGVLKPSVSGGASFDIQSRLGDRALDKAKRLAREKNRDWHFLVREYNDWIAQKGEPRNPDGAFLSFIQKKSKL